MTNNAFDQPVVLKQSPILSRAIMGTIIGVTTIAIAWAFIAKIEEAIPAQGKLEPQGRVSEIQAPVGGVVQEILVKDGDSVREGQAVIRLDPTAAEAQQSSLRKIRSSLLEENQFYRAQMQGIVVSDPTPELPGEVIPLTKNRATLLAENQLYRALLNNSSGRDLTPEQRLRLQSSQDETRSRVATAELEVEQLRRQLEQTKIQLVTARKIKATQEEILINLKRLYKEGGFSQIQYFNQVQEVQTRTADVEKLVQEEQRLQVAISQSKEKLQNTISLTQQDLQTKIATNEKSLADIDSQLNKAIVENKKRIAEVESQLSQAQLTLRYQDLKSPVNGTVFDLQAINPGFVTNSTTPILKIVPKDALVAQVYLTNQDIGFIKKGMDVDVRIDSFPYSEFGDIKGKLIEIGSDALPPEQARPYYSFPAKIRLNQQFLKINGNPIKLQSGMGVSVNIKLRQRTVASIFTDLFIKKVDSLKTVR